MPTISIHDITGDVEARRRIAKSYVRPRNKERHGGKRLTPEERNAIKRSLRLGMGITECAEKFNRSWLTISRIRNKMNLAPLPRGSRSHRKGNKCQKLD